MHRRCHGSWRRWIVVERGAIGGGPIGGGTFGGGTVGAFVHPGVLHREMLQCNIGSAARSAKRYRFKGDVQHGRMS